MENENIRLLLKELGRLRDQKASLAEDEKATSTALVEAMQEAGIKSLSADNVKGRLVETTRVNIDEDRLKKTLGAVMWKKVTTPKMDKEKLEAAVAMELIDPVEVAACSTTKTTNSIRVTFSKAKESDDAR